MRIPAQARLWYIASAFSLSASLLAAPSLLAQQSQQSSDPPGWPITNPDANRGRVIPNPMIGMQRADGNPEESCSLWDAPIAGSVVSAARLHVPSKAAEEYRKACSDLRHKKLESAERHLHSAVEQYEPYADAWVLLGEVLEAENNVDQAESACSKATQTDSNYTPGYLCMADAASRRKQWDQALNMANRALAIGSQDIYGYYYTAVAQFHLDDLPSAENNALQTINADRSHRLPQAHVLLAQIYGTKRDLYNAAAQLRAYLKLAPNSPDAAQVRSRLAELETQIQK